MVNTPILTIFDRIFLLECSEMISLLSNLTLIKRIRPERETRMIYETFAPLKKKIF